MKLGKAAPGVRNLVIEAIAGEKRSFALYRRAADLCQSGSVATLLRRLAADEWRHILLLIEY
ncbi:MAG: hypothetical protein KC466_15915, partial [Myxococcales bacterium]|nr:hypothetical protein [Myxococcales bacterium]